MLFSAFGLRANPGRPSIELSSRAPLVVAPSAPGGPGALGGKPPHTGSTSSFSPSPMGTAIFLQHLHWPRELCKNSGSSFIVPQFCSYVPTDGAHVSATHPPCLLPWRAPLDHRQRLLHQPRQPRAVHLLRGHLHLRLGVLRPCPPLIFLLRAFSTLATPCSRTSPWALLPCRHPFCLLRHRLHGLGLLLRGFGHLLLCRARLDLPVFGWGLLPRGRRL